MGEQIFRCGASRGAKSAMKALKFTKDRRVAFLRALADSGIVTIAAKHATATIPIVMAASPEEADFSFW